MDKELAERIWQKKLKSLFRRSNLPKEFWKPQTLVTREDDIDAWDFLEDTRKNIVEFVKEGNTLVITSVNVGNGKTSWAIRLLQRYLAETATFIEIEDRGMFINYASLLVDLGDFKFRETPEFKELKYRLMNCELLVMDELGGGSLNNATYQVFYEIINARSSKNLSTIYTTNFDEEYLIDVLGERVFSRVHDAATKIIFTSSNVRGMTIEEVEDIEDVGL